MPSKVDIVNMGLAKLGHERISAFADNSKAARLATDLYDLKRDEVLRTHDWDFARQRAVLSKLVDEASFGDLRNRFQTPADSLRILRFEDRRSVFRVEAGIIFTNESEAKIWYTRRETDTSLYDANFMDALSTRLAVDFCMPLLQDSRIRQALFEEYKYMLGLAKSYDSIQGTPDDIIVDGWATSRLGTGRPFGPGRLT